MSPPEHGPPGPPGPGGLVSDPSDSHQTHILVAAVVWWSLAAVFVGLRMYARLGLLQHGMAVEDWLVVASLVFSAGMTSTTILQVVYGVGRHLLDVPLENIVRMKKAEFAGSLLYVGSLALIKVSICLLYLRLLRFRHSSYVIWVLLVLVVLAAAWGLYGLFTACRPLNAYWTLPRPPDAECRPVKDFIMNTSFHIASDVIMYVLPLPLVLRMSVPLRQKLALYAILFLGLFVCVISIVRLWAFDQALKDPDITFAVTSIAYWSLIETDSSIIVACTMTLRPLMKRWFPRAWGYSPDQHSQRQGTADLGGDPANLGLPNYRPPPTIGSPPSPSKRPRFRNFLDTTSLTLPPTLRSTAITDAKDDSDGYDSHALVTQQSAGTLSAAATTTTITAAHSAAVEDNTKRASSILSDQSSMVATSRSRAGSKGARQFQGQSPQPHADEEVWTYGLRPPPPKGGHGGTAGTQLG